MITATDRLLTPSKESDQLLWRQAGLAADSPQRAGGKVTVTMHGNYHKARALGMTKVVMTTPYMAELEPGHA